jgi:pimeloyl-ACP methyl ester carboxylesterase
MSARPREVDPEWAIAGSADARRSTGFREHFRAARSGRFRGGATIDVPVHVVFAPQDRITPPRGGQVTDELPPDATIEHWEGCGHMVMWDAPDRVVGAALALGS